MNRYIRLYQPLKVQNRHVEKNKQLNMLEIIDKFLKYSHKYLFNILEPIEKKLQNTVLSRIGTLYVGEEFVKLSDNDQTIITVGS